MYLILGGTYTQPACDHIILGFTFIYAISAYHNNVYDFDYPIAKCAIRFYVL